MTKHRPRRTTRPLASPPKNPSRKQARKLTTAFHKLTQRHEQAIQKGHTKMAVQLQHEIAAARPQYQRASQTSTSFYSTSKTWVLGTLAQRGWLHGIVVEDNKVSDDDVGANHKGEEDNKTQQQQQQDEGANDARSSADITDLQGSDNIQPKKKKKRRRPTRLLEVGAINTELLDVSGNHCNPQHNSAKNEALPRRVYPNLHVRAIDLHAMDPRIEEADVMALPLDQSYHVIVCSMVLNCVPTPKQRGAMLVQLSQLSEPGGLVFVTVPRTCLYLSAHMTTQHFMALLQCLALFVVHTKESPKIAFFVCQKQLGNKSVNRIPQPYTTVPTLRMGKKYKNPFAIVLPPNTNI